MKIIVGLGNPGTKYENTRHNAGFMAIDRLAKKWNLDWNQEKFNAKFIKTKQNGEDVILLKPLTYMNESGFALRECLDFYKSGSEDVLILYDDVDLPVGKIRLRQKGSAGGHNGIKSIISCIFTQEFDRIRIGVGKDPKIPMVNWVLGKFKADEKNELDHALQEASEAAAYSIDHNFAQTMNQFNKK
ncbi:aminoacyl-tRNA hydrolase [Dubosiella newyorkensis]|jgi:PTH1 family peptidyl-tRNA hydrolase|uniref:Peptidyl-tRNA hydrolase n=1 Tax=Dubosiella newyorkensis TaxID=1862672 RepID=A0A1U7NPN7_9FIRM|nr:aminoacyl-tRNA hydrolase [Dubosiella newyorkensis]MCI9040258.1 aminoacyl-tRNA hydrolase [Dubosiella newyorkensis]OLU47603.1 aminoacyl-tRNA hydrolase [Dubosiella newyorkensis]